MAESCDVLARRQQPLKVESPKIGQLLTEYGKFRVEELKKGKEIPPEMVRRMKLLEFRIVKQSRILKDILDEILRACERAETVPEAELREKLQDVEEYYTDLAESNQERKDNVSCILGAEQEHFQKFRKLYDDVDWERKTSGVLSGCGAAAGLAVGLAAMCPVTLVGVALFTAISGVATAEHRSNAMRLQESLVKDMEAKNVPMQYLETLAKNLDDSIARLEIDAGKVSGRSARVRRRVDMMLEEIQGIQAAACQNFVGLASDPTLAAAFGITETRRLQEVQNELRNAAGLECLTTRLQEMPDSLLKMDVQNAIYRYFADSARLFKKIQHSIRSGEAELSVVCDGEEPRADDMQKAFEEFLEAVEAFSSWTEANRAAVGDDLKDRFDKEARDEMKAAAGGAAVAAGTGAVATAFSGLPAIPVALASLGAFVVGGGVLAQQQGSCAGLRKAPRDVVMSSWYDAGQSEGDILVFLSSWPAEFHKLSFPLALQRTRDLRDELDRFLQLLQMRGLIFDPCSRSSRFQ
ncbi:unnamed protein product [Symbiodinium sp. KB8]|nr:unnamed protein product [Symbiodinium sp. KB8]